MSDTVDTSLLGICFCNNFFLIFRYQYTWLLFNKNKRRTNFPNLFYQETLHVSGSSSAHHQEFSTVHSALVYVMHVWWQFSSSTWSCLKIVIKNAWRIPMPNVQWKTPDDGQKNCPKHVEFLDKINLGNWCVCWFYYKEICYDARSHERKIYIWYDIFILQLDCHPVAVVQYTFTHKQYTEQHKTNNT
jgi:hypothetical protein